MPLKIRYHFLRFGSQEEDITGSIDCEEVGRLNGEVEYQYDVTLENNTEVKLKVDYTVILLAGSERIKEHEHSTVLKPSESLTETHWEKMKEGDWDRVTSFRVEWEAEEI